VHGTGAKETPSGCERGGGAGRGRRALEMKGGGQPAQRREAGPAGASEFLRRKGGAGRGARVSNTGCGAD
jgi:hypothetical protein